MGTGLQPSRKNIWEGRLVAIESWFLHIPEKRVIPLSPSSLFIRPRRVGKKRRPTLFFRIVRGLRKKKRAKHALWGRNVLDSSN